MKKVNFILILVSTIFILSCHKDQHITSPATNLHIPQEIKDLIYIQGDDNATTVLINTQGGPMPELATEEFDEILQHVNTSNLLRVNVHQAQTLHPDLFVHNDITFAQAIDYDAESIEILYKVIKYFKDQHKTVYILGISFGAFMTQELIAKKGINIADKYLIMVGRLDINGVFWQGFKEGKGGSFEHGVTPVLIDQTHTLERNMSRLAAGLGRNRYTQVLDTYQDLSKITYIYGRMDDAVGRLTDYEIQFLQSKNVRIVAGSGSHSETIDNHIIRGFKDAFGIE